MSNPYKERGDSQDDRERRGSHPFFAYNDSALFPYLRQNKDKAQRIWRDTYVETRQSILLKRVRIKLGGHGMETGDPARHSRRKSRTARHYTEKAKN